MIYSSRARLMGVVMLGLASWLSPVLDGVGAADPPAQAENFLRMPLDGDVQLRVLSPTLLELTLVQVKQPDPAPVSRWNFVDASGNFTAPALSEFVVTAGGQAINVQSVGFKRRALYAPLKVRDYRVGSYLYLQLASPIADGASVTVLNPDGSLWSSNTVFAATADAQRFSPAIHVNQVGYMPAMSKKAMVGYYLGNLGEMQISATNIFQLVDAQTGATVFQGNFILRPDSGYVYTPTPYQKVLEADFSAFQTPGEYKMVVPGLGASFPFLIDDGVAATIARTYELGIYHQRSGTSNSFPFTRFTRGADHTAPAQIPTMSSEFDFVNGVLSGTSLGGDMSSNTPAMTNVAASYFPSVQQGTVDVSGGHFDAGDYSKYLINSTLFIHYLVFEADAIPGVKDLDNLGIPESGDGISDVLQEAKWEADFLAKMQDTDGGFYFLVYPKNRPYEIDVTPDHGDPQVVFPKNTSATAASVAALAEIASSPAFKAAYPTVASNYLAQAKLGWQFLQNAIAKYGRAGAYQRVTFYGDTFSHRDELAWAAAAMFVATGDPIYDNDLRTNTPNPNDPQYRRWTWLSMYGGYGCAFRDYAFAIRTGRLQANQVNASYLAACENEVRFAATNALVASGDNAYGSSFASNNKGLRVAGWYFSGEQTFDLAVAYQLEAKPDYLDVILKNYNYELGCNPVNVTYVTGLGWKRQREIVDQYAQNDYRTLPPSGIPLGNIQAGFDWIQNYQSELSAMSFPSDSSTAGTYAYYDRWSDTYNTTTEFVTATSAKSLAAAAMLMASSSVKTQSWQSATPQVTGLSATPTLVGQPITIALTAPGLDLSKARVVWESENQDPFIGSAFTFSPKSAGSHWIEAEAQLPDGRRVFALTNYSAVLPVANTIEQYQSTPLISDTNVVAWYSLDGVLTDSKGREPALTFGGKAAFDTNSFTWNNRPQGAAVRVSDVGDKLTVGLPNADVFQSGQTTSFSIEAMIYVNKFTAYGQANALLFGLTKSWGAQLAYQENIWIVDPFIVGGAQTIASGYAVTNDLTPGAWQHLKITLTATNYSVRINGMETANVPSTDLQLWNGYGSVALEIGNFDGWVDEIVVKSVGTPMTSTSGTTTTTTTTGGSTTTTTTTTSVAVAGTNFVTDPFAVDSSVAALYHLDNDFTEASGNYGNLVPSGAAALSSANLQWMANPSGSALHFTDLGDAATVTLTNVTLYQPGQSGAVAVEAMVFVNQFKGYGRGAATIISLSKRWDAQLIYRQDVWGTSPQLGGGSQTIFDAATLAQAIQTNCWQKISVLLDPTGYSVRVNDFEIARASSGDIANWAGAGDVTLTLGNFDGWIDEVAVRSNFTAPPATNSPVVTTTTTDTTTNTVPTTVDPGTNTVTPPPVVVVPIPVVSITATKLTATEAGPTSATFAVNRTGDTSAPLTVAFNVSGTATAGSDYASIGNTVTIAAGASSATVTIRPVDDQIVEDNETVTLNISSNPNYSIGSPNTATITIIDNDIPHLRILARAPTTTSAASTLAVASAAAAVVSSTVSATNTSVEIQADPAQNFSVVLQASTNLTKWTSLITNAPSAAMDYIDNSLQKFTCRFYRAVYVQGTVNTNTIAAAVLSGNVAEGVVGFVNISAPSGYSLIANPLDGGSTGAGLISALPNKTRLFKFNDGSVAVSTAKKAQSIGSWGQPAKTWTSTTAAPTGWTENIYTNGKWSNPSDLPDPGEGAFIYNPTNKSITLTFLGQVLPAGTTNNVPSGFSVRSSVAPIPGQLDTALGLKVSVNDVVYRYSTSSKAYVRSIYGTKGWDTKPVLKVGESFFIWKSTAVKWTNSVPNF